MQHFRMTQKDFTLIFIFCWTFVFPQKQFFGTYNKVDYNDSIPISDDCEKTKLTINKDFTFTFTSKVNKKECGDLKPVKFIGSWKFTGDTIFLFNEGFKPAKSPIVDLRQDSSINGIKVRVFDQEGTQLIISSIDVKRLSITGDTSNTDSADTSSVKDFTVTDRRIVQLTLYPENMGQFILDLSQTPFGTEIQVTCFSGYYESFFNGRQYYKKFKNLFEIPVCGGQTPFEFTRFKQD